MPKLEKLDLVDQFEKNELGESAHQTEDDLRVESGGPLGVQEKIGDTAPAKKRLFRKDIGKPAIRKPAEPEDEPHTYFDASRETEIENSEDALIDGITKRAKKRKETKRYFGIGDRRKKQQAQYKINVKIKAGEMPPPMQVWRHPDLENDNIDKETRRSAIRQNRGPFRGIPKWPATTEKKKPR